MKITRALGEKLLTSFENYIGEPNCVCGVPPAGEWSPDTGDYRAAQFSFYQRGPLLVGPVSMGLALRIPHTKDKGSYWMRVVLEFLIEGDTWSVTVGNGKTIRGLPIENAEAGLLPVHEEIFEYVKNIFLDPVSYFDAEKAGKIGFL
jgi:hypothetical protein